MPTSLDELQAQSDELKDSVDKLLASCGLTRADLEQSRITPDPFWAGLQPWLMEKGFQLRPRYRPGWKPSWLQEGFTGRSMFDCEDEQTPFKEYKMMDAVRISDGSFVMFKRAQKSHEWSQEAQLAEFLAQESIASDHRNHCVPILDILEVPDMKDEILIVMPLLHDFNKPDFGTVGEVVVFFKQIFEGLLFLHSHNIAHRDLKCSNIMADTGALYNERPHPASHGFRSYHGYKWIWQRFSRTKRPINYFLIDFDLSTQYQSRSGNLEPSPWGPLNVSRRVPEFNAPNFTPADPFPVDIYMMGMMIREHFVGGDDSEHRINWPRVNMEWMEELVQDMIQPDPLARPTAEQLVERYDALWKGLSTWKLHAPVHEVTKLLPTLRNVKHWVVQLYRMARRVPVLPIPKPRELIR